MNGPIKTPGPLFAGGICFYTVCFSQTLPPVGYIGRIPMPDVPHPLQLVGGGRDDATAAERELQRLRAEIEARNRQETAIAELGQAALTGVDPTILLGQACALVEMTLQVDHARALEVADGRVMLLASIGSNPTFAHCGHEDEENERIGMYAS